MKIIAKVNDYTALCEVNADEMALLKGYSSRHEYDKQFGSADLLRIGSTCELQKIVNTSRRVKNMRKDTLERAKQRLEEAIAQIDMAMETVGELQIFDTLAESDMID